MPAPREDLIRLARETVERTTDVHEYHGIPAKFDPHEWVLEAMLAAYNRGRAEARESLYRAGATLSTDGENTGRG